MGEYANHGSTRIKIGTCGDLYYLRADQRHEVHGGDVHGPDYWTGMRFRFPWPDEDDMAPGGDFHANDYNRSIPVPGATVPEGVEHYTVQFSARPPGYLVSLPCPEGEDHSHGLTVHRNGFSGRVRLVRQKLAEDGRLLPILQCGGCGTMWRLEDPADIEELAVLCRSEADRRDGSAFWHTVAARILAGAGISPELVE